MSLPCQLQKLVLDPLSEIHLPPTVVVIIDALDGYGTTDDRATLLSVLAQDFVNLPVYTRTVVTSRAESNIYNGFES
jgi:hypothetical protein